MAGFPAASGDATVLMIDEMKTGSISPMSSADGGFDKQRGDQGAFFGASGR